MKSNLVKVSALIAGLSIATATVSVTKVAEAVPQDSKLQFVQDTQSETQPEVIKEQIGKLKIVNNTPFIAIVQLYQPNADQPDRYAYIPPCYERSLLNTYSNLWQVSFNSQGKKAIGDVSEKKGNTFVVRTSNLNQDTNRTCLYKLTAEPVVEIPWQEFLALGKTAFKNIEKLPIPDWLKMDNLARIKAKLDLHFFNSLPIEIQILGQPKVQEIQELLSSLSPNISGGKKTFYKSKKVFDELWQKNGLPPTTDEEFTKISNFASTINDQNQTIMAMLPKNTVFNGNPIQQAQGGTGVTNVSAKEALSFASVIYKNDLFRVSSIIDFSKWYASSESQSKPASGAYNVAALNN